MLDDDDPWPMTHHPPRLAQDELDHTRVLGGAGGKLSRSRTRLDRGQIGITPLALGHDLLRDNEDIASGRGLAGAGEAVCNQGC